MKCPNCHSEWNPSAKTSTVLASCPFCGKSLVEKNVENSAEHTLIAIYQQYGEAGMRDGKKLLGCFMDLAPSLKGEKKLLQIFIQCKGHTQLLDANNKNLTEVTKTAERVVIQMNQEHLMDKKPCRAFCEAFCRAIGCDIQITEQNSQQNKKEGSVTPKPPQPPKSPQPQNSTPSSDAGKSVSAQPLGGSSERKPGRAVLAVCALLLIGVVLFVVLPKGGFNSSSQSGRTSYAQPETQKALSGVNWQSQPAATQSSGKQELFHNGSLFPDSSTRFLREEEIAGIQASGGLTRAKLIQHAINELYARHHYPFSQEYWRNFYNSYSWYSPRADYDEQKTVGEFNEIEKANLEMLTAARDKEKDN